MYRYTGSVLICGRSNHETINHFASEQEHSIVSIMASHLLTAGSVYCDDILKDGGMNGEYLRGGSVLVTKTHSMRPMKWGSILTTVNMYGIEVCMIGRMIKMPISTIIMMADDIISLRDSLEGDLTYL